MTTGIRRPGQFSWINMLTSDTAKARDFFGKVLGWTYHEIPGMGHIVLVDGKEVGGLWDINSPQTPPGARPYIGVMVKVDSADATAAKVKSLGGDAKDAFDVMDQGRMAVCHDPAGAEFDIWQARKRPGDVGRRPQTRDAELVRVPDEGCSRREEVLRRLVRLVGGDERDARRVRLYHVQAGRRVRRRDDGNHAGHGRDEVTLGSLLLGGQGR
jgi:predicted enzyme related to lactoylglutathione lyase